MDSGVKSQEINKLVFHQMPFALALDPSALDGLHGPVWEKLFSQPGRE